MNIDEKDIERIIRSIDPDFERLEKTPARVLRAFNDFFSGYETDISKISNSLFSSEIDDLIILKNIPFESHCEHHMVPMIGTVSIGYVPNGKIIGASKLGRIVDCFAHRLQLQERLTMEIASAVQSVVCARGVAVYMEAEHFCISHRGVRKNGAKLITRYFLGDLKNNTEMRKEFLASLKSNG